MKSLAWRHQFKSQPWSELRERYEDLASGEPAFGYMVEIVKSVEASLSRELLAAMTSMHDLLVTDRPIADPPLEVLRVSAPVGSLNPADNGDVVIEHLSHSGRNDRVERSAAEAVPLFWRFVVEKFGIEGQQAENGSGDEP
ncbi:MAG TPA: hypothetical protein P5193_01205 [Microthrixaceae bacterium]|nr:hypothetical protein [Microthrixaceae bacterium]MCB9374866.1 hypothetical protein [Microthrixaceae bacterium]MCB9400919.1 hypothetical protein [Microthrixaceae bacterium]MCO5304966.1 hypothetical protein [Microthrixaceae bacterium]HMU78618.1 hypothetical protein [Microthrixaceae bacterium]